MSGVWSIGIVDFFFLYERCLFPISHPQRLKVLTTLGVMAAVRGTRIKMKLLWIAYARASCVHIPNLVNSQNSPNPYIYRERERHLLAPSPSFAFVASKTP